MPVSPDIELFLREQLEGRVHTKRMFGGYGVYTDVKCVAFLLNDALFLRPLPEIRAYIEGTGHDLVMDGPVKGAKSYYRIDPDLWEDGDWLMGLIRTAHEVIPAPKPKAKPKAKPKKTRRESGKD
ncbi:TfoX/Sxy family protein [Thioclava sp. GXIMD4216]|uniref:TfoX/Sxy family protein n=1 Tax=Thioclava sp. GXIMD4216 TaxID=3131929 RepID=UPI0030CD29FC